VRDECDHRVVASGRQDVTDHRPGVERDAGTPAERAHLERGEHPERRIAAVEQPQAPRLEGGTMLDQERALVLLVGSDEGIADEAVERVVDLGDPRQGGRITVGGKPLALCVSVE
jgi:hypothetical protein